MENKEINTEVSTDVKKPRKSNIIFNCAIIAIAAVLVVCAVLIVIKVVNYKKADDTYDGVSDDVGDIIENNKDETPKDSWTRPDGWVGFVPDDSNGTGDEGGNSGNTGAPDDSTNTGNGTETPGGSGNGGSDSDTPGDSDGSNAEVPDSSEGDTDKEPEIEHSQLYLDMKEMLDYLNSINPEVYGYVRVEISNSKGIHEISYPIMQSKDNDDYYLNHMLNKEKNESGSLFVPGITKEKIESNKNVVIFGHNMQNGTMLHDLTELLRSEEAFMGVKGKDQYYTDITVFTYDGIYKFDVFSVNTAKSTDNYYKTFFTGSDEFVSFCEYLQSRSKWSKGYKFTGGDVLLTFSTCTNYLVGDDRIAVHALLVKISQ